MKQLLIVNSQKAINAKTNGAGADVTPYDLSNLAEGAISFFELGASSVLSTSAPTKNFAIALGMKNSPVFLIPEVDIDTLEITKTLPSQKVPFLFEFTMPTCEVGKEYGVTIVKKGTVPHERNTWTVSIVASVTTAATNATALVKAINDKMGSSTTISATASSTTVSITSSAEDWTVKFIDKLSGTSATTNTAFQKAIGDKAYVQDLASQCAAGKGFDLLGEDGAKIYPGYPEAVENLVPNNVSGSSTAGYAIWNLHFATKREGGKQLNERVWQYVHIAVPVSSTPGSVYKSIDVILPEGKFNAVKTQVPDAATTTAPGSGYLTKTVADTLYDAIGG